MTSAEWSESVDPEPMLSTTLPSASDRKRRLFAVACCRQVENWLVGEFSFEGRDDDYRNAVDAAERFADGKATVQEMGKAFENADDSAFCNEDLEDVPTAEMRKACFGDDTGWPSRMKLDEDQQEEMETYPDPAAWLEADDNADFVLPGGVDPFRDVAQEDAVVVGETIGRKILLLVRHYGDKTREAEERAIQAAFVRDIFGDPFPPPAFAPAWRTPNVTALAASIDEDRKFDRMPDLADALEEAGCDDPVILGHCRGPGPHVRGCWALDQILGKE